MSELIIDGARIEIPPGVRLDLRGWTSENSRVKNNWIEGPGIVEPDEEVVWVRIHPRRWTPDKSKGEIHQGPVRTR